MRRLKVVVTAIVAVAALSAVMSASAFAVALPEFTVETPAKGTIGGSTFETTSALLGSITSTKGTSEIAATSKQLGTFHFMFEGVKCHGPFGESAAGESLGDAKEIVLVLGALHLVVGPGGVVLVWFLVKPVHIECLFSTGTLLLVVGKEATKEEEEKGTVSTNNLLGELTPTKTKTTKYSVKITQSKGKQGITEYENDKGEKLKASLTTSIDEGSPVGSAQESKEANITTEKETELILK